MTYGFKIIEDLRGLNNWMDKSGHNNLSDIIGRAVPNVTDWQYLNLNYVAKRELTKILVLDVDDAISLVEDTSHPSDYKWTMEKTF